MPNKGSGKPEYGEPWKVIEAMDSHRRGSYACANSCGKGGLPVRIEHDTEAEAAKFGDPSNTELHIMSSGNVDDIASTPGDHIVCFGHDYGEYGGVSMQDANRIVACVNACEGLTDEELLAIPNLRQMAEACELLVTSVEAGNTLEGVAYRAAKAALKFKGGNHEIPSDR